MKKIISAFLLSGILLSSAALSAGNGFLEQKDFLKKRELRPISLLEPTKRLADGGDKCFGEGKFVLSLGYGAYSGGLLKAILKAYEDSAGYNFTSLGPIHFRGEMGISDNVGLVLSVNHNNWKASWNHMDSSLTNVYHNEFKRSVTSILARFNFHFNISDNLDPYWGIGAGYRMVDYSFTSTDATYNITWTNPMALGFETTVGIRYYITKGIGLYAEIGLAQSLLQGGLVANF